MASEVGGWSPEYDNTPGKLFESLSIASQTWIPDETRRSKSWRFLPDASFCNLGNHKGMSTRLENGIMSFLLHSRRNDFRSIPVSATLVESLGCLAFGRTSNCSPLNACVGIVFGGRPTADLFISRSPKQSCNKMYALLGLSILYTRHSNHYIICFHVHF